MAQVTQGQVQEKEEQPEAGGCTHASEELVGVPGRVLLRWHKARTSENPADPSRILFFRVSCVPMAVS